MKKVYSGIALLMAAAIAVTLQSCRFGCVHGSGHQVTENRKMGDFTKIDIGGNYKVVLRQDSSFNVNVTADDNLQKYIKTSVEDGELRIHSKKKMCNSGEMTIVIGVKNLEELRSSGAMELTNEGKLTVKDINFDLAGATKLTLNMDANNVTTDGSGVTEMHLEGQAKSHHVDISGVAKIYALNFVVSDYDIETSGASHCDVNALKTLDVHSSGASEVRYKGSPSISNDKSGASSIEPAN